MDRKMLPIVVVIIIGICLSGCMHPQIMDPFTTGFAENEYLVIKITDTDQIGQLWEALPEVDAKGEPVPLRWRGTTKLLFPQSDVVNRVIPFIQDQVRYAFENVGGSTKFTAAAIIEASATSDSAYKYESKSQNGSRFDMQTLGFAPAGAEYMRARLAEKNNYEFAYLSAIYIGTAFVEVLSNTKAAGGGNYAAFQLGTEYYVSVNKRFVSSGAIIFQLTPIDPLEVGVPRPGATPMPIPEPKIPPLTKAQIDKIKMLLPEHLRQMVE